MNIRLIFVAAASLLIVSCESDDGGDRYYGQGQSREYDGRSYDGRQYDGRQYDRSYQGGSNRSQTNTAELRRQCQQGVRNACVALGEAVDQQQGSGQRRDLYNDRNYENRGPNNLVN